jgi:hypothetical protein
MTPFHGSYRPSDVEFLLKQIQIEFMEDLALKERLIQSGKRHYSEMLTPERLPSERYMSLFHLAHRANLETLAKCSLTLAKRLYENYGDKIVIVSLARAGTPIGAILVHLLEAIFSIRPKHFSISIIRDRGIDKIALREILKRGHAPESIAFVDGWTGKGVISRELKKSIASFNEEEGVEIDSSLAVISDLSGTAEFSASSDDFLISSAILNSTISGLVSRSILNESIGANDFHGCVYFEQFASHDLSRWFVDDVVSAALAWHGAHSFPEESPVESNALQNISKNFLMSMRKRYGIEDINLIKPGIGEATRVLLRRFPERLILRDINDENTAHLIRLAKEKNTIIDIDARLPYRAASIIRSHHDS